MIDTKSMILDLLSRNYSLRAREILHLTKLNSSSITRAINILLDQGLIFPRWGKHPDNRTWIRYFSLNWDNALD